MVLSLDSFALKIVKKSEESAFSNKAKIVNINIPEKVKIYIEENMSKEINYFKKRNKMEFNLISDKNLILPEYKICLLNKNKKVLKKIENLIKTERSMQNSNSNNKMFSKPKYHKNFNKRKLFKKKYNQGNKIKRNNFYNKNAS